MSSSNNNGSRIVKKYYSRTQQIEIVIETLSGTAFEMTVLPSETIFSIKAKIQRVEGIPISHQHLIHNMRELQNDQATLADCGLRNGSRLRLVLSLRGGPISTRRLPVLSCSDVESEQDFGFEPIPSGGHIVLLMQDGEQLSLFKVVENEDGSFSPMTESWSSKKTTVCCVDTAEESSHYDADLVELRAKENEATRSKVEDLRNRMEQLNLQKKKKKSQIAKFPPAPIAPTAVHQISGPPREWTSHLPSLRPLSPRHIDIQQSLRPLLPPIQSRVPSRLTTGAAPMFECSSSVSSSPIEHPVRQTHLSHFVLDNRPKTSPEKLYVVGHSLAQEIQKETKEMCRILGEVRRRHWSQELANRSDTSLPVVPPQQQQQTAIKQQQSSSQQITKKTRRYRCSECRRKLNITNTHTCRCGKHFCASHRYAETHNCTYDYKADGKKYLAQNNPLVVATKLPKI